MTLRPYQLHAIAELRRLVREGKRKIVLVIPTGGGKTIVAAEVIRSAVARGKRVLFIAHRKELIDQAVDKLARFGVDAGVIMADDPRADATKMVQVAAIQTLARRMDSLPEADIVIYDECHHSTSNTSIDVLAHYASAVVIGLTATPWRTDKVGLDFFDAHVVAATPSDLMKLGALVDYEPWAFYSPDLDGVDTFAGDFNQGQLGLACNTKVLVCNVVDEYLRHASGKQALCFPVNIVHSKHLVEQFVLRGVKAQHLDCDTPKAERELILAAFAAGVVQVLSSVGVLTEGFDCPVAEVCILVRPTQSLPLCLQMMGAC